MGLIEVLPNVILDTTGLKAEFDPTNTCGPRLAVSGDARHSLFCDDDALAVWGKLRAHVLPEPGVVAGALAGLAALEDIQRRLGEATTDIIDLREQLRELRAGKNVLEERLDAAELRLVAIEGRDATMPDDVNAALNAAASKVRGSKAKNVPAPAPVADPEMPRRFRWKEEHEPTIFPAPKDGWRFGCYFPAEKVSAVGTLLFAGELGDGAVEWIDPPPADEAEAEPVAAKPPAPTLGCPNCKATSFRGGYHPHGMVRCEGCDMLLSQSELIPVDGEAVISDAAQPAPPAPATAPNCTAPDLFAPCCGEPPRIDSVTIEWPGGRETFKRAEADGPVPAVVAPSDAAHAIAVQIVEFLKGEPANDDARIRWVAERLEEFREGATITVPNSPPEGWFRFDGYIAHGITGLMVVHKPQLFELRFGDKSSRLRGVFVSEAAALAAAQSILAEHGKAAPVTSAPGEPDGGDEDHGGPVS